MQIEITPVTRGFDGRTVYRWRLIDGSGRCRETGCELTERSAERKAERALEHIGPDLLLDMLECR